MIGRRDFIAGFGGAAALPAVWLLAACDQKPAKQPELPVVALVHGGSAEAEARGLAAFREGMSQTGYVEGQNVTVEYHWLEGRDDRMPAVMADLVRRNVAVIIAIGPGYAAAAKALTTTIPIIFNVGDDPAKLGLVASLARPGGNLTGINEFANEVMGRQLDLLNQMLPKAVRIAVLYSAGPPGGASQGQAILRDVQQAALTLEVQTQLVQASTIAEIDAAFAALARERPDALFVLLGPFMSSRRVQLATLAARDRIPAMYGDRDDVAAGGLMSYGVDLPDIVRQTGVYTGQILKGAKPADLPVQQATKFQFVINRGTARLLGIEVPPQLIALADEVIE